MRRRKDRANPLNLPLVEITWADHTTRSGGWRPLKDARTVPLAECRDVGRLVARTRKQVILAGMVSSDGDVNNLMQIPGGWVQKIRRLR